MYIKGNNRMAAAMLAFCLLSACGQTELYTQLTERQANEMVAVLHSAGIAAGKRSRDGQGWSVSAPPTQFAAAVEVLHAHGHPREQHETLCRVFKKEGFVSSPLEERARLTCGLAQELSTTMTAIDGVVVARVHLALPEKDPLADKPRPASASVFIKHRPSVDLNAQIGKIKALVVNSVEGLPYENVTVALFAAQPWPLVQTVGAPLNGNAARWTSWAAAAVVLVAVAGGLWWWRRRPAPLSALRVVESGRG